MRFLPVFFLALGTWICPASDSALQGVPAENIHISGISNAGKVDGFLYRGSQPSKEGLEQLKELGVHTIIDLRGERHGVMEQERRLAESMGIHFVNIPGDGWEPPGDEQVAQFFSLVRDNSKQQIFVHCWFGSDRTGVFLAAYRMTFDGWTPEQALREMLAFHFKRFWHPAMKAYILDFPARLARSQTLEPFRPKQPVGSK
jgi:protein tyrosine/serine phosphatase